MSEVHFAQNMMKMIKSVLRIGSAHNKGGPADINIAQISHLLNFSDLKFWFIFIYEHSKPEKIDIQLWYIIFYKISSSKYKQRVCLHYGLYRSSPTNFF